MRQRIWPHRCLIDTGLQPAMKRRSDKLPNHLRTQMRASKSQQCSIAPGFTMRLLIWPHRSQKYTRFQPAMKRRSDKSPNHLRTQMRASKSKQSPFAPGFTMRLLIWPHRSFRDTRLQPYQKTQKQQTKKAPKGAFFQISEYYSMILATTPAPTVRPPSRIAKRRPSSIAIGLIRVTSILMLSPGITISTPSGSSQAPVMSVVRK